MGAEAARNERIWKTYQPPQAPNWQTQKEEGHPQNP
jgi:hypothetical protein